MEIDKTVALFLVAKILISLLFTSVQKMTALLNAINIMIADMTTLIAVMDHVQTYLVHVLKVTLAAQCLHQ